MNTRRYDVVDPQNGKLFQENHIIAKTAKEAVMKYLDEKKITYKKLKYGYDSTAYLINAREIIVNNAGCFCFIGIRKWWQVQF